MQAPLRRAHRRLWPVLTVVLVLGFIASLALRPEKPIEPGSVIEEGQG